jgi:flavin reductase (DIM6/NTAB) family NADH-FMN oxidoreductase RutF
MTEEARRAYECVTSHLDNPVFVATVASGDRRAGCLVGFASQCSIHPPRWYVGVSKLNYTYEVAATADLVVVHALGAGDVELARLFGEESGDEIDKFSLCSWHPGPDGRTPVLNDCGRWFAGAVVHVFDPGDHLGLVLAPVAAECRDHGPQLGILSVSDFNPGHPA